MMGAVNTLNGVEIFVLVFAYTVADLIVGIGFGLWMKGKITARKYDSLAEARFARRLENQSENVG